MPPLQACLLPASRQPCCDITEDEIRAVFAEKGYYPKDTPWSVLQSEGFVDGWIIPYWTNIVDAIMTLRTNQSVPF